MPAVTLYINNLKEPTTVAVDASNNVYVADANSRSVLKIAASNLARTTVAGGQDVSGVDVDASGNVFTCFKSSSQIFKNNVFWASHPLIQGASDLAVDSAGNVLVACSGTNCIVKISAT